MTRQELYKLADQYQLEQEKNTIFSLESQKEAMLTEGCLKQFHQMIGGTGQYRAEDFKGEKYGVTPAEASELPRLMGHFISQLQISRQMFHPIEYASICHKRILELCPFENKNEEVAFLVLNLLLSQAGYMPIAIQQEERSTYLKVLQNAQHPSAPDIDTFITFIAECEVRAQEKLQEQK